MLLAILLEFLGVLGEVLLKVLAHFPKVFAHLVSAFLELLPAFLSSQNKSDVTKEKSDNNEAAA